MAGFTPDSIAEYLKAHPANNESDFEVYEENWQFVSLFLDLATQWNVAVGLDGLRYLGINHTAIASTFNLTSFPKKERKIAFRVIKMMESEALQVLNAPK